MIAVYVCVCVCLNNLWKTIEGWDGIWMDKLCVDATSSGNGGGDHTARLNAHAEDKANAKHRNTEFKHSFPPLPLLTTFHRVPCIVVD